MRLAVSASRPPIAAMIVDLVRPQDRSEPSRSTTGPSTSVSLVSTALAGLQAVPPGYLSLFLGDAATALVCAVMMWVRLPETRPERSRDRVAGHGCADEFPADPAGFPVRDALPARTRRLAAALSRGGVILPVDMAGHGISTQAYGLIIALNGLVIVLLQLPVTALVNGRNLGPAPVLAVSALLLGAGFGPDQARRHLADPLCAQRGDLTLGEISVRPGVVGRRRGAGAPAVPRPLPGCLRSQRASVASILCTAARRPRLLDRWGGHGLWTLCAVVGAVAAACFLILFRRPRGTPARRACPIAEPLDYMQELNLVGGNRPSVYDYIIGGGGAAGCVIAGATVRETAHHAGSFRAPADAGGPSSKPWRRSHSPRRTAARTADTDAGPAGRY